MNDNYEGPVRLAPIPWGKPDKDTGFALCAHMRHANPPIVILWSVHHAKVLRCMKHDEVREANTDDIDNLVLGHTPKFHKTDRGVLAARDSLRRMQDAVHRYLDADDVVRP